MFVYLMFILVGVSLIIYNLDRLFRLLYPLYRKRTAAKNWPETTAAVTSMKVNSYYRSRAGRYHWAEARYSFTVDGVEYKSKVKLETFLGRRAAALQNTEKLPAGRSLPVRYNPQNPQECFTTYDKPGAYELMNAGILLLCGILLVIGMATRFH